MPWNWLQAETRAIGSTQTSSVGKGPGQPWDGTSHDVWQTWPKPHERVRLGPNDTGLRPKIIGASLVAHRSKALPMPKWKTLHAFTREVEERSLAKWAPKNDVQEAVLAVADAVLEIIETHELLPRHVQSFVRSAELLDPDPRAWRPGCNRMLQTVRLFPETAMEALTALLDEPKSAARLLAACQDKVQLTDTERERAFETLLAASPATTLEALQGESLRSVRIRVQQLESERTPRTSGEVLADLEVHLDPKTDDLSPMVREAGVVLGELARVLEPGHLDQVLAWLERWPEDDFGGFLPDLARVIGDVDGGQTALVASFRRRATLAVADYLEYQCEDFDARPLFVEALERDDLPNSLRRDLADLAEEDE